MIRAILVLCILLIAHWIFQWRLTVWKVKEIHEATKKVESKIDTLKSELDTVIQQYTKDPEAWKRTKDHIK